MATRFYLPASAAVTPISPTPDAAWEDTTLLARAVTDTVTISDAMATVSFTDITEDNNRDVLFRQYISPTLAANQTITGAQALKAQIRGSETALSNNMFVSVGVRILGSDGTTVRKTVLAVTRDNVELVLTTLTNRQYTATSAAGNYTTATGDRLVIEIGTGGLPIVGDNRSSLRFGDAAASDLAENDTATSDDRPWVEFTDTLTYPVAVSGGGTRGMAQRYRRGKRRHGRRQ